MQTTPKEICPYAVVLATLERVGWSGVHVVREGAPHLGGHARTSVGLRRGLDGAPSTAPAPSVGWAVRGLVIELLAPTSRPCSDDTAEQRNGDGTMEVR
jgi:hypothetical protein